MKALRIFAHSRMLSENIQNKLTKENIKFNIIMARTMSTIDPKEIDHHSDWKNTWWEEKGILAPLHSFNIIRMEFIRNGLANVGFKPQNPAFSLEEIKIADIGCGGGILTESLARAGARVTGIDAAIDLTDVAKEHVKLDPNILDRIDYICTNIEEFSQNNKESYDVVVASEVMEHVLNPELFLKECVKILKPGGSVFLTTLNKTFVSWLSAIVIGEYLINIVPRGTHQWNKFIAPHEVQCILDQYGCRTKLIHGVKYNPLSNNWSWTSCTAINYVLHAVKQKKIDA